jgi:catechol 2,3-dioxygenase-like lactoylglutathione lyase family enzyme
MSIRVKDYHHVAIVIRNLDKCKWFYGEILGLETIERPPFDFPGHWFQVGKNTQLHLMVFEEQIPETMRHIAIEVEDFDDTIKHLEADGIKIVDGPGKRIDGSDYLFCKDPDGNLVEITRH